MLLRAKRREDYRKKRSLEFRLRRYRLRLEEFEAKKAKGLENGIKKQKNKNRQAAALKRARDKNGKFGSKDEQEYLSNH